MVCLMPYLSYSDLCLPRPLKMSLGRDSFCELAARSISLLILAAPDEDTASTAWEGFLGHAYFFTGWGGICFGYLYLAPPGSID